MSSIFKRKSTRIIFSSFIALLVITYIAAYTLQHIHKNDINNDEVVSIDNLHLNEKINIQLFHTPKPEKGLLIYIDDNNTTSESNARQFASLSYYVARIDSKSLLSSPTDNENQCINIADQLSAIAEQLQKNHAIAIEGLPILVGNNDGAALVYSALAQTEKNHFHAGISINFTPLITSNLPLCTVHNFTSNNINMQAHILPTKHLPSSWYIFQNDGIAANVDSNQFIAKISNAKLTASERNPSTSIEEAMQILQWLDPRLADQISSDNGDTDLPLIEVTADNNEETPMAVLLTGDGGWAEIDKNLAKFLADKNIPTVALDSLSYFWKARTPETTAKDVDDIISLYSEKWHKKQVILIGYSFGADVLPFIANRLSDTNKANISLIALLGMGTTAAFEFHLSSWMDSDTGSHRLPILPEVQNMQWANSVCIYGVEDEETACTKTSEFGVKVISMSGDHHFDEKYDELVDRIIENIKK